MIGVTDNFRKIQDLLAKATRDAGRPAGSVRLLAVSKLQPVEAVLEASRSGQLDFGEITVGEGVRKIREAGRNDLVWHFIGHLQANKSRPVAEHFAWVHTVDRLKIAERLSDQRPSGMEPLNICIQVNIDHEPNKSGVAPAELDELALSVAALPRLRLRGLMCIPAIRYSFEEQRQPFARLREIRDNLTDRGLQLDTLSMGMSADFVAAIHEGATIVRLGTALFGQRDT